MRGARLVLEVESGGPREKPGEMGETHFATLCFPAAFQQLKRRAQLLYARTDTAGGWRGVQARHPFKQPGAPPVRSAVSRQSQCRMTTGCLQWWITVWGGALQGGVGGSERDDERTRTHAHRHPLFSPVEQPAPKSPKQYQSLTVRAAAAQEELLERPLVVLGHHHARRVQALRAVADELPDGVGAGVAADQVDCGSR